jgi:Tfp pilus assembly protein PilX
VQSIERIFLPEQGTVLIATLLLLTLLGTLGAALALTVSTESVTAANYEAGQRALYAADAGVERTVGELRALASWRSMPGPASTSGSADFNDGLSFAVAPDGANLDFAQLTARRQTESNALYPNTADRPAWRLFAHATMNQITADSVNASPYVIVWVADDPDDLDGDPAIDTNDVVMVHAEAFGVRGGRRAIEATIQREEAMAAGLPGVMRSDVRLIAWHEVR